MKRYRILICLATAVAAVSCGQENLKPENSEADLTPAKTFSFTAIQEGTPKPAESKAIVGINANEKPQTFWEDGDKITVFSKADFDPEDENTKLMTGYVFQTALGAPSPEAEFTFDGEFPVSDEYIAVYPYSESTKTVNFSEHKMVQFFVPENQTLPAEGGFDKNAALSIACVDDGGLSLEFKNATALIKFRVADADIVGGSIVVDDANYIAGTLRVNLTDATQPALETYGSNPKYSKIDFTIDGTTPLTPGTDYYVAVRPTTLTNGFKVYINGYLAASYTSSQVAAFVRSKIYNISTPLTKTGATELLLDFDVTEFANMTDIPTAGTMPDGKDMTYVWEWTYRLYGTDYGFASMNPTDGNIKYASFPYYNSTEEAIAMANSRFIGLPSIENYKLTAVTVNIKKAQNTQWGPGITSTTVVSPTAVEGGEKALTEKATLTKTFTLSGTAANTRYWLWNGGDSSSKGSIWINSLILTYTHN